jgi:hypothetical protein
MDRAMRRPHGGDRSKVYIINLVYNINDLAGTWRDHSKLHNIQLAPAPTGAFV